MFHTLGGFETALEKVALVFHIPGGFETALEKIALVFHTLSGSETVLGKIAFVFHFRSGSETGSRKIVILFPNPWRILYSFGKSIRLFSASAAPPQFLTKLLYIATLLILVPTLACVLSKIY